MSGGIIPDHILPKLQQNVKMIFSNNHAFVALLDDGNIFAWGNENYGSKIPSEVQTKLIKNVKLIIPKTKQFTALSKDGKLFTWGDR